MSFLVDPCDVSSPKHDPVGKARDDDEVLKSSAANKWDGPIHQIKPSTSLLAVDRCKPVFCLGGTTSMALGPNQEHPSGDRDRSADSRQHEKDVVHRLAV